MLENLNKLSKKIDPVIETSPSPIEIPMATCNLPTDVDSLYEPPAVLVNLEDLGECFDINTFLTNNLASETCDKIIQM